MVSLTPEQWARRQLAAMGNTNPSQESIDYYIDILEKKIDESTMDSQDVEVNKWMREMYDRDVKNFSGTFWERRKMIKSRKKQQKRRK